MDNVSYIGLSQQMALKRQMDLVANNMANMSTPGFKSENALFGEYVTKAQNDHPEKGISEVQSAGAYRNLAQGTLTQTANRLDFAIQGDGYFAVRTQNGVEYTRDGSFTMSSNRDVITQNGDQVLNDQGSPLTVQPGASQITLNADGTLSTEKGSIGKIKVVTFAAEQAMTAVGNNLYEVTGAREIPVSKPHIEQGMLENSNVQPVVEMNRMIDILRNFQAAQKMVTDDHDEKRTMIQQLTKV